MPKSDSTARFIFSVLVMIASAASAAPGDIDTGFGTNGVAVANFGELQSTAACVAIQNDGKVLVAGNGWNGTGNFTLVRFESTGEIDTSFGTRGIQAQALGGSSQGAKCIEIQKDGKILVGGMIYTGIDHDFVLLRYTEDGELDPGFGTGGIVSTPVGPSTDVLRDIAIQEDGKIVVVGYVFNGSHHDLALLRYSENGSLDNGFNGDGMVINTSIDYGLSLAIQGDGKIVVTGYVPYMDNVEIVLLRYTAEGELDPAFGFRGVLREAIGSTADVGQCVSLQTDGKIIVAGRTRSANQYDVALLRFGADGRRDAAFGSAGVVVLSTPSVGDSARSMALQGDGKIVVGIYSSGRLSIARFTTSGQLDQTFGSDGKADIPLSNSEDGEKIAIQKDGKIVVAGFTSDGTHAKMAVVRVLGDPPIGKPGNEDDEKSPSKLKISGSTRFGMIEVGNRSRTQRLTLSNIGDENIDVTSIGILGKARREFHIAASGSKSIRPGGRLTLWVKFAPVVPGRREAILRIQTKVGTLSHRLEGTARKEQGFHHPIRRPSATNPGSGRI